MRSDPLAAVDSLMRPRGALFALVCGVVMCALVGSAHAVDPTPRVKPRTGLRKHVEKRGDSDSKPGNATTGAIGVTTKFAKGSPEGVLREAFACALDFDEATGFDCYVKQNSEINQGTSRALKHLRRYQWAHFRKWAPSYVLKGKEFSVFVTRWNPPSYDETTRDLRIYLRSRNRDNPAPIMLRREQGLWKIYSNSL